jgi:hypothetical protein
MAATVGEAPLNPCHVAAQNGSVGNAQTLFSAGPIGASWSSDPGVKNHRALECAPSGFSRRGRTRLMHTDALGGERG